MNRNGFENFTYVHMKDGFAVFDYDIGEFIIKNILKQENADNIVKILKSDLRDRKLLATNKAKIERRKWKKTHSVTNRNK